ncbi:MAG: hypothetical protein DRH70_04145 [Candidatus Coatesbacteria bacterium]|nr:MAG: hypothetical protein DRH70_04145 [Candidatus Coatesbacteria bacterium]
MDAGFLLLIAIDRFKGSLQVLAEAVAEEIIASREIYFFKRGVQELWLYARQARSVDALMVHLMSAIGNSPPEMRWRQRGVGQRILKNLNSDVRQISERIAGAAEANWDPGVWLIAAQTYLSYLCQSHSFDVVETSGPEGLGPAENESDGASGP